MLQIRTLRSTPSSLEIMYFMKRKKTNKRSTAFEPAFYIATQVDGSSIATLYSVQGE